MVKGMGKMNVILSVGFLNLFFRRSTLAQREILDHAKVIVNILTGNFTLEHDCPVLEKPSLINSTHVSFNRHKGIWHHKN